MQMGCFTLKNPMFVTYSLVITNIESTVCVCVYMYTLLASCQIKGNFVIFVVLHWYFHTRDILFFIFLTPRTQGARYPEVILHVCPLCVRDHTPATICEVTNDKHLASTLASIGLFTFVVWSVKLIVWVVVLCLFYVYILESEQVV